MLVLLPPSSTRCWEFPLKEALETFEKAKKHLLEE